MATYLDSGYKILNRDISEYIEHSRDTATDPPSPFAERGYYNAGKEFSLTNAVAAEEFSTDAFDINPYLKTGLAGDFPLLMGRGCRPRLDLTKVNFYKTFVGTSQIQYYYVSRTDTTLYIFSSYSPNSGYSLVHSISINDVSSINAQYGNTIYSSVRSLLSGGIPKIMYAELVGGGGGGAGGTWGILDTSKGGSGGAGGGLILVQFAVGAYRSNFSTRDSSIDYYFSVHKGGAGGQWAGILSSSQTRGYDGTDTVFYAPDGTVVSIAIRGEGGNPNQMTTEGYSISPKLGIYAYPSCYGGRHNQDGEDLVSSTINMVHRELVKTLVLGAKGGLADRSYESSNGGGGGASKGNGGNGRGYKKLGPYPGVLGGGGGGGSGGIGEASNGASGGAGALSFFY